MKNVLEFLEETVAKYPDRYAVEDKNLRLTWKELQESAQMTGSFLCKVCKPGRSVAIVAEKSTFMLAAMLGTVYAGAFYVIVDPSQPAERMREIFEVSDPDAVIITDEEMRMDIEKIQNKEKIYSLQRMMNEKIDAAELDRRRDGSSEEDILYGIFTSGSTGKPKCVVVQHRAVIDFITHFTETFGFTEKDRIGNQAPFDFDVSVKDIYSCLATGAELVLIPKTLFSLPSMLLDEICHKKVTVLIWAASALGMVAALKGLEYKVPSDVRKIFFSGEVMPAKLLKVWQKALPETEFVNLYGPTEITCNCTYYPIKKICDEDEKIPIGKPFAGRKIFLLDDKGNVVTEARKKGEICVTGESLAAGYYRNKEETDRHFKILSLDGDACRCYLTGDMGYYGEDGNLYFAGRRDFQIKHMGHRIELEEIESRVEQMDDVQRCCCVMDEKRNRLAAFYLGDAGQKEIRKYLKKVLPSYMIPQTICRTDRIPLNKNGKTDRKYFKDRMETGT